MSDKSNQRLFSPAQWIIIIVSIIGLPLFTNWIIQFTNPIEYIFPYQDSPWISYFGNFSGAIVAGIITLIVLYKTIKQNQKNHSDIIELQERVVNQNERIVELQETALEINELNHRQLAELQLQALRYDNNKKKLDNMRDILLKTIRVFDPETVQYELSLLSDLKSNTPTYNYSNFANRYRDNATEIIWVANFSKSYNGSLFADEYSKILDLAISFANYLYYIKICLDSNHIELLNEEVGKIHKSGFISKEILDYFTTPGNDLYDSTQEVIDEMVHDWWKKMMDNQGKLTNAAFDLLNKEYKLLEELFEIKE